MVRVEAGSFSRSLTPTFFFGMGPLFWGTCLFSTHPLNTLGHGTFSYLQLCLALDNLAGTLPATQNSAERSLSQHFLIDKDTAAPTCALTNWRSA